MNRSPQMFLILMAAAASLAFAVWNALLNNFTIEQAGFSGVEIGILQSLREVPGFLAFTTVFVLLVIREQRFAVLSVALLGLGVALTGFLPNPFALYFTTLLMSVGFHYFYTLQQSLTLQWIDKQEAPVAMGRQSSASSVAALLAFALIWIGTRWLSLDYLMMYLLAGGACMVLAALAWLSFPDYPEIVPQHKRLVLRKRYWLYYLLVFFSGARRQIFMVFAGFLLVEKFGYSVADIALLYFANHAINAVLAPRIGRLVSQFGERSALLLEYLGLIVVFVSYAFVSAGWVAAVLYVADHLLFSFAISIRSYFQKIADPADIAATASVSFTINHIAAVALPGLLGLVWIHSPSTVFLCGAALAACSLLCAVLIPRHPGEGNEVQSLFPFPRTSHTQESR